ncbi:redoxin domain-containing protein [Halalkalibacillus halophilus]|uniref:redoxin domain-containing protein n=1 Tax=Halalkalibacillus halophilus TaxID=392827 RepID=UPI000400AD72|nr:redoxin domain-containing protein [Halalkalibacillus halophilus]
MKKYIILTLIVSMFAWAVYEFAVDQNDTVQEEHNEEEEYMVSGEPEDVNADDIEVGLDLGSEAPDFELETLEGEIVQLSDYRGQKVMINFWATWCPPCRAEMPDMQSVYEDEEVEILAVNLSSTEAARSDVVNFVDDFGLTFPILLDKYEEVANLYEISPVPTSYLVDTNGVIQFKMIGPLNYEMMVQEFEKMD